MRTTLRALLALGLLAGFYVLVFAIVAIDLFALVELVTLPSAPGVTRVLGVPGNALQPAVFSVPLLIAVFYGVFRVSGRDTLIAWSVPVGRGQAPELWAAVETLAGQVGTPAPSEIRLISEANAMVTEESFLLGLVPGRQRLLYIGAPLLVGMTADELRAVLCHELGHYARKHTRLAALVYRGSMSLSSTLGELRQQRAGRSGSGFKMDYTWLLLVPLSLYARLYYRLSRAVSRRQELEADSAAAAITGPSVTADALRSVHAIGVCWEVFRADVVAPMRRTGRMPDDAFSAFGALLADPAFEPRLARLRESVPDRPASRLDTHPSFATRLDLLSQMPAVPVVRSSRPAEDLIASRARLFERASRALSPDGAHLLGWRQWLEQVAQTRATGPARMLRRAMTRLSSAADSRPLAAVLDLVEAGRARQIAAELSGSAPSPGPPEPTARPPSPGPPEPTARPPSPGPPQPTGPPEPTAPSEPTRPGEPSAADHGETLLLAGMFSLVGQALVAMNAASWQLTLDGGCALVARDITGDELAALLAAAVARPSEVPRLRLHLAALGVDVTAPIALADSEQAPSATARPMAQTAGSRQHRYSIQTAIVTAFLIAALAITGLAASSKPASLPGANLPGASPLEPGSYTPPAYQSPPSIEPGTGLLPSPGVSLTPFPRSFPTIAIPLGNSTIVVRPGETLSSIASGCDLTVARLQAINNLGSSTAIYAGQRLEVPTLSLILGTCR